MRPMRLSRAVRTNKLRIALWGAIMAEEALRIAIILINKWRFTITLEGSPITYH